MAAWKYFTEAFLFHLYVSKDQAQEQYGCQVWFCFDFWQTEEWLFTLVTRLFRLQ